MDGHIKGLMIEMKTFLRILFGLACIVSIILMGYLIAIIRAVIGV
jgi:hypothetical protein